MTLSKQGDVSNPPLAFIVAIVSPGGAERLPLFLLTWQGGAFLTVIANSIGEREQVKAANPFSKDFFPSYQSCYKRIKIRKAGERTSSWV